jgi:hypothetical protein
MLKPYQPFLIADAGWNASRDDTSWPKADYEEAITLANTGGTVVLIDSNGNVADSADYPACDQGTSAWRYGSTMLLTDPVFTAADVMTVLSMGGSTESLILLDNNTLTSTVQLKAGGIKNLTIVSNKPGTALFNSTAIVLVQANNSYTGTLSLAYTIPPGNHSIKLANTSLEYTFKVEPLLALDQDTAAVTINGNSIEGDESFGTAKPTLRNSGNIPLTVKMARTSIVRNSQKSSGKVSINGQELTTKAVNITTLKPGQTMALSLIVQAEEAGNYTAALVISGAAQ